ncbi:MAG: hypothetical protein IAG10_26515 [Planctomycetaceae bacterium]|nr:hypothetical protein [Planctomycetaceae bacterium]
MKKFGIWLVLLVMLLALAATPLASRLVQVRGSWQKKTAEAKVKVLDLRKKAHEAEKAVEIAKGELQRTIHGWERYWIAPQVTEGRQPGTLAVALGTNQGFAPAGNSIPIVYAFQPSAEGMIYVGSFKISAAQEAQAALTPNWRLRPDEEKTWRYGPNWRFRSNIPLQHRTQFSDYEKTMLIKDELVAQQQKNLADQKTAKEKAEEQLALRMKELNGDPDRATQNLDKFLIDGFHKAVADLEIARNNVQSEVDDLRRQVKRTRDEIERLTQENERLADQGAGDVPRAAANKQQ